MAIKDVSVFLCLFLLSTTSSYAVDSVVSPDYLSSLKEQAVQGDAIAEYNLGVLYHNGEGVPQDYKQAVKWLRKSAAQGYARAALNLFAVYHDGQGVPRDDKQAAAWCQRAADEGDAKAQMFLYGLYKRGDGVPQDNKLAMKWLLRAVQNGGPVAMPHEPLRAPETPASKARVAVLSLATAFAILMGYLGFGFFRRKRS